MSVSTGKKRKRDNHSIRSEPQLNLGQEDISAKLRGKLHHGFKGVLKSVKKTKAFEAQRLVKKLKHLRKAAHDADEANEEIDDLEAQLEYLKRVDPEHIAQLAISSKIRKDKTLSSYESLTFTLGAGIPASTTTEARHGKVESRLLSSKVLAGEVDSVLAGLKSVLEPKSKLHSAGDERTNAYRAGMEYEIKEDSNGDYPKAEFTAGETIHRLRDDDLTGDSNSEVGGAHDMADQGGWESGSIDTGDSESNNNGETLSAMPLRKRLKSVPDLSRTHAEPSDQDASKAVSTFLPSLSVGFVRGDSDSDFDDFDEGVINDGKKNRRGQRARRAIWEKKYGKNAKHLKRQREEAEANPNIRKLGKRPDRAWKGLIGPSQPDIGHGHEKRDKPAVTLGGNRGAERPVHPSWDAKKKLKEKEGARILPSQGKKIIFR